MTRSSTIKSNKKIKTKSMLAALGVLTIIGFNMNMSEASAAGYHVDQWAQTTNFSSWDRLNIRKWPAAHSQKINQIKVGKWVKVKRCIIKSGTDWCLIKKGNKKGWVNGHFIQRNYQTFATPHPTAYGWH